MRKRNKIVREEEGCKFWEGWGIVKGQRPMLRVASVFIIHPTDSKTYSGE